MASLPIEIAGATDTEITPAVADRSTKIEQIVLTADDDTLIVFAIDDVPVTGPLLLLGGGSVTLDNIKFLKAPPGQAISLVQTGTANIGGVVVFKLIPPDWY